MGRLLIFIGIVGFIGAMAYFFWVLQGPENPQVAQFLTRLHCNSEETIVQEFGNYVRTSSSSGRETAYYCQVGDNQRDVTLPVIATIGGGFAIPLAISVVCFIIGSTLSMRRVTQNLLTNAIGLPNMPNGMNVQSFSVQRGTPTVINLRGGSANLDTLDPQTAQKLEQVLGSFGSLFNIADSLPDTPSLSLADRLKQLEDAKAQGLISNMEYEQARRAILDKLDD